MTSILKLFFLTKGVNMEKKLEEPALLADKIYNLSCILKEYCKINPNMIEDIANLYPLVEYIHHNIDILNSIFININFDAEKK